VADLRGKDRPATDLLADARWELAGCAPGAISEPAGLSGLDGWVTAAVPGTVAGTLRERCPVAAGRHVDIDERDWWWRARIDAGRTRGPWLMQVGGLATVADVWVNGTLVLHSENMFRSHVVELPDLGPPAEVVIRCAASQPLVTGRRPRPRWKSPLVAEQGWRWLRTSLLGRIEGWGTGAPAAGPWRPVRLRCLDRPVVVGGRVAATLDGGAGIVRADIEVRGPLPPGSIRLHVGEQCGPAVQADGGRRVSATVRLAAVQPWWPHTHGGQPLYPVTLEIGGHMIPVTRVGFRTVTVDTAQGAFRLLVNGTPVFARGACWVPLDPVSLQAPPEQVRDAVGQARDAGLNLIRVVGTMTYEDESFYAACDEAGLLVWQDCMLASLDPPTEPAFAGEVSAEVSELADRLAGHPCLAVVCGSNELEQQPALLGMSPDATSSPLVREVIPAILAERLPGIPYLPSAPTGGELPMRLRSGVAHYFGVGAYLRPLQDVRTAGIRFAAECLAFSIPPERASIQEFFRRPSVAGHHPAWKAGVPRDARSSWDFEDIRDYYVREIFGTDPLQARYSEPDRYLDLGRAAVCVAMSEVFTQWRRPGSGCAGGVILSLRDLLPGAGWGLVDVLGQAKAPWYALRRVLAPAAMLISDDGMDGVVVTVVNDTARELAGQLSVRLWSVHGAAIGSEVIEVAVPARGAREWTLDGILGRFSDAGYAYRFGPRTHDLLHACLITADGQVAAESVSLLGNHLRPLRRGGLGGQLSAGRTGWLADISAEGLAQWVSLSADGYRPADSWFHLAPGMARTVPLIPLGGTTKPPVLSIRALNVEEVIVTAGPHGRPG
jgi:beta-mannosidase